MVSKISDRMVRSAEAILMERIGDVMEFKIEGKQHVSWSFKPNVYDLAYDMLVNAIAHSPPPEQPPQSFAPKPKFDGDVSIADVALAFRRLRYGDMMEFATGTGCDAARVHNWALDYDPCPKETTSSTSLMTESPPLAGS